MTLAGPPLPPNPTLASVTATSPNPLHQNPTNKMYHQGNGKKIRETFMGELQLTMF